MHGLMEWEHATPKVDGYMQLAKSEPSCQKCPCMSIGDTLTEKRSADLEAILAGPLISLDGIDIAGQVVME